MQVIFVYNNCWGKFLCVGNDTLVWCARHAQEFHLLSIKYFIPNSSWCSFQILKQMEHLKWKRHSWDKKKPKTLLTLLRLSWHESFVFRFRGWSPTLFELRKGNGICVFNSYLYFEHFGFCILVNYRYFSSFLLAWKYRTPIIVMVF